VAPDPNARFAAVAIGDGDRHAVVLDVHLLIERGFEVLLVRRTGPGGGTFHLPTGPVRAHESLIESAARIAAETIGIEVDPSAVRFGHAIDDAVGLGHLGLLLATDRWIGDPEVSDGYDALVWVPNTDPPDRTDPVVAAALDSFMHGVHFSQAGSRAGGNGARSSPQVWERDALSLLGWASDG
jgi:ADP-ribose pyrophosphatase YjhB (NUDIX family)